MPFVTGIFWAVVLAILFFPIQKRLTKRLPRYPTVNALLTLLLAILVVLLPITFITQSVVSELYVLYQSIQSGSFDAGHLYEKILNGVPPTVHRWLDHMGFSNLEAMKDNISQFAKQAVQLIGNQAFNLGQNTFMFVIELGIMLYLMFFLLRDGEKLSNLITDAIPLSSTHKTRFMSRVATVVRATIKGNVAVAVCQGILGGLIFWVLNIPQPTLWGAVMAVLSLLPAVGAGLVWGPVAVYFLATGDIYKGVVLGLYGLLVISLVDNVLRPILVGKDTRLPDYLVLLSTLGGLSLFGLSGFVAGPLIAVLFLVAWDLFRVMNDNQPSLIDMDESDVPPQVKQSSAVSDQKPSDQADS